MLASELKGITQAFASGLLTAAGAESVYDTTVAIQFSINGEMGTARTTVNGGTTPLLDGDGVALATLVGTATAGQGCAMVWCLKADATVVVFQGPIRALDAAGVFDIAPDFPTIDESVYCPFAFQILKHTADASTITFGTSNWNATGFTNTITNVSVLPARPQIL